MDEEPLPAGGSGDTMETLLRRRISQKRPAVEFDDEDAREKRQRQEMVEVFKMDANVEVEVCENELQDWPRLSLHDARAQAALKL